MGALKSKLLLCAGAGAIGFSASRSGVDCGAEVENICVNEPGLELAGPELIAGSAAGNAAGGGVKGAALGGPPAGFA
jgi:hypothetical protein